MTTTNLSTLSPATLTALSKALADAAKDAREALSVGTFNVEEKVLLSVSGTVKVGEDYEQKIVNKAKPWNVIAVLLGELNTERLATGKAGIDMAMIIKMAEAVDPTLVKQAQDAADGEAAALKAPTLTKCNGKVTVKATVEALGGSPTV